MQKLLNEWRKLLAEGSEFIDDLAWPKEWVDEQREIAAACKTMECSPQDIKRMLKGRPIVVPELEWLAADEQKLKDKVDEWAHSWGPAGGDPSTGAAVAMPGHWLVVLKTLNKIPRKVLQKLSNIAAGGAGPDYTNLKEKIDITLRFPDLKDAEKEARNRETLRGGGTVSGKGKTQVRMEKVPVKEIKTIIKEEAQKELKNLKKKNLTFKKLYILIIIKDE